MDNQERYEKYKDTGLMDIAGRQFLIGYYQENPIKTMRTALRLSQAKFAELFNIPRRSIENWESGTNKPPQYLIDLLLEVINNRYK